MTRTATTALVAEAKTTADACESGIAIGRCRSARSSAQHSQLQSCGLPMSRRVSTRTSRSGRGMGPADSLPPEKSEPGLRTTLS